MVQVGDKKEIGEYQSRQGASKKNSDVADSMKLFLIADVNKIKLPLYVTKDLWQIPRIKPSDTNLVSIAQSVVNLVSQVMELTKAVAGQSILHDISLRLEHLEKFQAREWEEQQVCEESSRKQQKKDKHLVDVDVRI